MGVSVAAGATPPAAAPAAGVAVSAAVSVSVTVSVTVVVTVAVGIPASPGAVVAVTAAVAGVEAAETEAAAAGVVETVAGFSWLVRARKTKNAVTPETTTLTRMMTSHCLVEGDDDIPAGI
jgi:hypothetical protein